MMSTRRALRLLRDTVVGAVVEDIHALPAVIVHSSVGVVAAKFASSLSKATSDGQNHHLSAERQRNFFARCERGRPPIGFGCAAALNGPAMPRSGERAHRARSVRHSIPDESLGR